MIKNIFDYFLPPSSKLSGVFFPFLPPCCAIEPVATVFLLSGLFDLGDLSLGDFGERLPSLFESDF